jgi:hypothetical protein
MWIKNLIAPAVAAFLRVPAMLRIEVVAVFLGVVTGVFFFLTSPTWGAERAPVFLWALPLSALVSGAFYLLAQFLGRIKPQTRVKKSAVAALTTGAGGSLLLLLDLMSYVDTGVLNLRWTLSLPLIALLLAITVVLSDSLNKSDG